jgi:site-specific recombinase XerD
LTFIQNKLLPAANLNDLQGFAKRLVEQGYSPATQTRRINTLKSLLSYGYNLGVLTSNVGKLLKTPKVKNTLAEKILSETQIHTMMALTRNERDRLLLRFLYATGARVSEICGLCWRDLQQAGQGHGQVTLFGKGGKTRVIIFSSETWLQLQAMNDSPSPDDPVFKSRKNRALCRSQIGRIVVTAAKRTGITGQVSPHWLRHAHASHALERGTPIALVQATLGHANPATTGVYLHARPKTSSALALSV